MRLELVFFRLMLVVMVASAVGFGSVWAYQTKQANDWGIALQEERDSMAMSPTDQFLCSGADVNTPGCKLFRYRETRFDQANQSQYEARLSARKYGLLAIAVPFLVALLFYSLRWAVTGKLRPLRPD